jgi:hypothetical protein
VDEDQTPTALSQRVRSEIGASLRRDFEFRGARTARRLVLAGVAGVVGALGAILLVAGHSFGHHAPWHVLAFSVAWTGLLVVTIAIALLEIRTPSLPLARSAIVGLIGLGVAGVCGAACPDSHFLVWWSDSPLGGEVTESLGAGLSATCFGLVSAFAIGSLATLLALLGSHEDVLRPALPVVFLGLLLFPGVALQSVGTSWAVFAGWMLATIVGAYAGVTGGMRLRRILVG